MATMLAALLGARVAAAQTVASLKIIEGDGQVPCSCETATLQNYQPLTVQALDGNGRGVPNATVTWTVTSGEATVGSSGNTTNTTTTDSNGISTTPLTQVVIINLGSPVRTHLPSTIVAAVGGTSASATFYEDFGLIDNFGLSMVKANGPVMNGQPLPTTLPAANTGSTLSPIQLLVADEQGINVPDVSIQLIPTPGQNSPTITCAPSSPTANPGAVLTGGFISSNPPLNGSCTPVLGGSGTGQFYIMIGGVATSHAAASGGIVNTNGTAVTWVSGAVNFGSDATGGVAAGQDIEINGVQYVVSSVTSPTSLVLTSSAGIQNGVLWTPYVPLYLQELGPYTFTAIPGTPVGIVTVQGNNQALAPGQSLGTLIAEVVDVRGNGVQGATVAWAANPNAAVALGQTSTTTDNNGYVTAAASFSGAAAGNVNITVTLANNPNISGVFTETAVVPVGRLNKISGDGQSAQAGATFAAPVVVQVLGSSGIAITNYPVQFSVTGPAILSQTSVNTNSSGQAQVTVTAGSTPGAVTVTASVGGFSQTFTLTVAPTGPVPTGITIVSGNSQGAVVGTNFPSPLIVELNSGTVGVANSLVTFTSSGPVSLSSTSVYTNANGQASVNATAGAATGTATVTAFAAGFSVTFTLTVNPTGPTINTASFANAASGQVGALSPCGLATITGTGLDPNGAAGLFPQPIFGPLPTLVNGISVNVSNVFAPIFSAQLVNGQPQVLVQMPCETTPGSSVPVTVNVGGGTATVNVPVQAAAPGIFQTTYSDGTIRAVVLRSDGSFATLLNPARLNETVRIYVTGLGPTFPVVGTGQVDNPGADLINADAKATGQVNVAITGANGVTVTSARLAANLIGVFEVAFTIPSTAPVGNSNVMSVGVVPAGSSTVFNSVTSLIPIGQ